MFDGSSTRYLGITICITPIPNSGTAFWALQHISLHLQTPELCLSAFQQNPDCQKLIKLPHTTQLILSQSVHLDSEEEDSSSTTGLVLKL